MSRLSDLTIRLKMTTAENVLLLDETIARARSLCEVLKSSCNSVCSIDKDKFEKPSSDDDKICLVNKRETNRSVRLRSPSSFRQRSQFERNKNRDIVCYFVTIEKEQ